jgi:uncharacterized 2Fe-2S/4Fe-4S cluster protein (DUF4445 family)
MSNLYSITFLPQAIKVSVPDGSTILEAALFAGVQVDSICGGKGKCGKCRVKILTGEVGEPTGLEQQVLSAEEIQKNIRLACQTRIQEGMEVLVSREHENGGLKGKEIDITRLIDFEAGGKKRCEEFLSIEYGGTRRESYGLAVDLGTTTVAVYLVDLKSGRMLTSGAALNKQSSFGADVISRISYAKEHSEGLAALQKGAVDTINQLLDDLSAKNLFDRENISLVIMVGNPTMMHLFLGINPQGLAEFPFKPAFSDSVILEAGEAGLRLPSHTRLEILPLVSAYVGADLVAASLAAGLDDPGPPRLLLDIGTNGEIALAYNGQIRACSTAAGPALEGGGITFGMQAAPGSISAVTIMDDVELSIIGPHPAQGICGSGLVDAVAQLLDKGMIGRTGRLKEVHHLPEDLSPAIKRRVSPGRKGRIFYLTPEVYLTQEDIIQLQLAKAAMRAGVEILMAEAGIGYDELEEVLLAGAFGANLRPESLITLGLLPPVPKEKVKPIGNAAGKGALLCLLSEGHHQKALKLARDILHLELSLNPDFQKRFMEGMKFEIKR